MNGKRVEESSCGLIWGAFDWRDWEKPNKLMVALRGGAEVWIWCIKNVKQEC